ncbi:MAG: hypothetical protein RIQ93_1352, partial [Verrucomicrobiota bacterium]
MTSLSRVPLRAFWPILLAVSAHAAAELPRGQVLERVECSADTSQ